MSQPAEARHDDPHDVIWTSRDYEAFFAHDDPEVRAWALRRLHCLHPTVATTLAPRGLQDPARAVQRAALEHIETLEPLPLAALREYAARDDLSAGLRAQALELDASVSRGEQAPQERIRLELELGDPAAADEVPALLNDDVLRERATRSFALGDPQESYGLLRALECVPWRWASRLLAERLEVVLTTAIGDEIWDAITELGDPELLDVVLPQWRPGELSIAHAAVFLATLGDRLADVPERVRDDAARQRRALAAFEHDVAGGRDPFDALAAHGLCLRLRCMDCDRTYTYDVERAFVDVEAFRSDERRNAGEWDGVVLGRIVACKNCGAEDRYSLSSQAQLAIAAQLSLGHLHDEDRESQRVTAASLRLWDGTILRRPTQGIARLRAACERQPDTGEPWRRLGNLYERFGLMDEAEDAWRRAVDDEAEVEAAYSLATRFRDCGRGEDAVEFALLAIERLPGAKALPQRAAIATILCDLLRAAANRMEPPLALMATWLGGTTGDRATVHLSCAQLRDIHHWDRLAELIGAGFFSGLRFTDDLPEDPDPQLLRLLEVQTAYVRSHPKVGRNSPCPCGSGRKYKKCCLR